MRTKTQADMVNEELFSRPRTTTEKLSIPGIETLHGKSKEEIAEVLAMVLKSRLNITEFRYVVGKYVEVTTEN